jgi:hypothetical protein
MVGQLCDGLDRKGSTHVANHDLLAGFRLCIGGATKATACSSEPARIIAMAIHPEPPWASGCSCLLIRARIICVKILIREITACTRLSAEATAETSSESATPKPTATKATKTTTESASTSAERAWT